MCGEPLDLGQVVAELGVLLLEVAIRSVWRRRKACCRSAVVIAIMAGYRPLLTDVTVVSNGAWPLCVRIR